MKNCSNRLLCAVVVAFLVTNICCIRAEASEIALNRMFSDYQETSYYADEMSCKMNCYGYALRVYALHGTSWNVYKQQPGEFADNNVTFAQERAVYTYIRDNASGTAFLDYIQGRMYADFARISSLYSTEWSITQTTAEAVVPIGYRKIALTVGCGLDYHFYMRHSDGSWSHKRGAFPISYESIDTHESIIDNNITSKVVEGGYDDGVRYYLISKPPIVDYSHDYGHDDNCIVTGLLFSDKAGDDFQHSTTIAIGSREGRNDYENDKDYFMFVAPGYGNKTISVTPIASGAADFDMKLFNAEGVQIASDLSGDDPIITYYLSAGARYFIEVSEYNGELCRYTISISQ